MTVVEAEWVCPITSPPIRNGAIAIENGRIAGLGDSSKIQGTNRRRHSGCIIIPGFVNAHAHLELTILRGMFENLSFSDWIRRMVRIKYQLMTADDYRLSARLGATEMLRAGITTVAEVMDIGTGWDAMKEFGLRGIAFQEVFGPAESAAGKAMEGLIRKLGRYRTDESRTMRAGVSPHAPYTVSRPLFERVRDFARRESLHMTTHGAESHDETLFVRDGGGPFAEAHAARGIEVTPRGCSPLAYLENLGLLGPDMLIAHAVEADDRDLELLQKNRTPVVHCPKSNAKLGNGVARVREMQDCGISLSLGTDSIASNESLDMFEEMRAAQSNGLTTSEVFRMSTIEGALALGLEDELGSLEPGKLADFSIVDLGWQKPVVEPLEEIVASATRENIRAVYLAGREVSLENEQLWTLAQPVIKRLKE